MSSLSGAPFFCHPTNPTPTYLESWTMNWSCFSLSCLLTKSGGHSNLLIQFGFLCLSALFGRWSVALFFPGKTASSTTIRSFSFFFFIFFQNNKNSLTNKDFFILSISTCIYSWRWNKQPVMSISSPLGSVPTPMLPHHPPAGLTREYQGLLLCLWRGIQAIQWLVTRYF